MTLAKYNRGYIDFVTGDEKEVGKSFLQMNEYGPFDVREAKHMEKVACLVLMLRENLANKYHERWMDGAFI